MVERQDSVKKDIQLYYKAVSKLYDVRAMFLFGSYAKGNPGKDSDIDIGVVINDLEKYDEITVMCDLFKATRPINTLIEPLCIAWKDYKKPVKASILSEIIKTSISII